MQLNWSQDNSHGYHTFPIFPFTWKDQLIQSMHIPGEAMSTKIWHLQRMVMALFSSRVLQTFHVRVTHLFCNGHLPVNWKTLRFQWPDSVKHGLQTVTITLTSQFFSLVTKDTFFQIILVSVDTKYQSTQADGNQSYQDKFYFSNFKTK